MSLQPIAKFQPLDTDDRDHVPVLLEEVNVGRTDKRSVGKVAFGRYTNCRRESICLMFSRFFGPETGFLLGVGGVVGVGFSEVVQRFAGKTKLSSAI